MASGNSTTRTVFRPVPSQPGDSPSGDSPGVSKPVPPTPLPCRASPWHHPPVIHHRVPEKVGVDRDCPPRAKSRPPKPKPTSIPIPRAIFPVKTGPFVRSIAARRGPAQTASLVPRITPAPAESAVQPAPLKPTPVEFELTGLLEWRQGNPGLTHRQFDSRQKTTCETPHSDRVASINESPGKASQPALHDRGKK